MMRKNALLLTATVSLFALSACFSSSNGNGSLQLNNARPDAGGSTGSIIGKHEVHSVSTTNLDIVDNRFNVEFTADETIVITDATSGKSITLTADEYTGGGPLEFMAMHASYFNYTGGGASNFTNPDFTLVSVMMPTAEKDNEYALLRVGTDDDESWMLVGTPTSATLNGKATYSGAYYISGGVGTAQGDMTLAADFAKSTDAIQVTLQRPEADTSNDVFGAESINFNANFDSASNTLSAVSAATSGGHYDAANIHGAFFNNGDATAGLISLQDTTATHQGYYGGYHALKD